MEGNKCQNDRPDHSRRNDNLPFNQSSPARSIKSWIVCTKENVFQQNLLQKTYFIFKLTGYPLGTETNMPRGMYHIYFSFPIDSNPWPILHICKRCQNWKTFAISDKMTQCSHSVGYYQKRLDNLQTLETTLWNDCLKHQLNGWSTNTILHNICLTKHSFISFICRRTGKWRFRKLFIDRGKHVLFRFLRGLRH